MRWETPISHCLAGFILLASSLTCVCQTAKTTIKDKLMGKDGHHANGKVLVHWNNFLAADGHQVQGGDVLVPLGPDGELTVSLVPNLGATPIGSYYVVQISLDDGTKTHEYWVVPKSDSKAPIPLSKVRNQVLPTGPVAGHIVMSEIICP